MPGFFPLILVWYRVHHRLWKFQIIFETYFWINNDEYELIIGKISHREEAGASHTPGQRSPWEVRSSCFGTLAKHYNQDAPKGDWTKSRFVSDQGIFSQSRRGAKRINGQKICVNQRNPCQSWLRHNLVWEVHTLCPKTTFKIQNSKLPNGKGASSPHPYGQSDGRHLRVCLQSWGGWIEVEGITPPHQLCCKFLPPTTLSIPHSQLISRHLIFLKSRHDDHFLISDVGNVGGIGLLRRGIN